jgi:hypothetical protein
MRNPKRQCLSANSYYPNNMTDDPELPMSSLCAIMGCEKKAAYNFPGRFAKYCLEHTTVGMKTQPRRRCRYKDCGNFAIYADAKHRKPEGVYCIDHKPLFGYVTVVRHKCLKCRKIMPALVKNLCGQCEKTIR